MLDCEGGGTRTDISGQLNFLRGSGPHERECEWTIENPDNSSNVIVTGFHNSEDCGYGFIDSHMLLHSQSFHIWWSSLFAYRAALGSVFQAFSGLVPSKEKRKVALCEKPFRGALLTFFFLRPPIFMLRSKKLNQPGGGLKPWDNFCNTCDIKYV